MPGLLAVAALIFTPQSWGGELVKTIEHMQERPLWESGRYRDGGSRSLIFLALPLYWSDSLHVVTNAHVVPEVLDTVNKESYVVITGKGSEPDLRTATVSAVDKEHDLALLKIAGTALPPMELGDASRFREGQTLVFTGFPIGMILGFYPVTHRAMVSAITPIILPVHNSKQLNPK